MQLEEVKEEEMLAEDLLPRFEKYVQTKNIDKNSFCRPVHLYLTMEELF